MKEIVNMFAVLLSIVTVGMGAQVSSNVSVVPTPSIPVELMEATISPAAGGFQQISYTLSNISAQRLIAAEVTWKYQFANGRATTSRQRLDFLFSTDGAVAPGASQKHVAGIPRGQTNPAPLEHATGQIAFAEFADGATFGSDQASMTAWVDSTYQAQHDAYERLLAVYSLRGPEGLKAELGSGSVSDTLEMGVLKEILSRLEQRGGISEAVARIKQGASVKLPLSPPQNP